MPDAGWCLRARCGWSGAIRRRRVGRAEAEDAWHDGTKHLAISPLKFMQGVAVLVPRKHRPIWPIARGTHRRLLRGGQSGAVSVGEGSTAGLREVDLDAVDLPVDRAARYSTFVGDGPRPADLPVTNDGNGPAQ